MGRIEDRLDELGLSLPTPTTSPGNYQPVLVHAGLAYVAGHGPFDGSTPLNRSAPGQGPSPFNVPVIVDAIVAVKEA